MTVLPRRPAGHNTTARVLEQDGAVDEAWFVLWAHDGNPDLRRPWKAWAALLPDPAARSCDGAVIAGIGGD